MDPSNEGSARVLEVAPILTTTAVPAPVRELHERVRELVLQGRGETARATMRIPNAHYVDPAIAAAELRTTFAAPLLVAPNALLASPGDYVTQRLVDVPVLVTRDENSRARVFVNACRHRGAQIVSGEGCARRFSCPYHAWTYDNAGALVGMPGRKGFDDIDPATLGLVELPSEERHGFVWTLRDPQGVLDLDAHLGPLDAELTAWGMQYHVAATMELELASNWKCALREQHCPPHRSESPALRRGQGGGVLRRLHAAHPGDRARRGCGRAGELGARAGGRSYGRNPRTQRSGVSGGAPAAARRPREGRRGRDYRYGGESA
jgi:nitrite reductase/ring-hydroxylating ferredoxin subunit